MQEIAFAAFRRLQLFTRYTQGNAHCFAWLEMPVRTTSRTPRRTPRKTQLPEALNTHSMSPSNGRITSSSSTASFGNCQAANIKSATWQASSKRCLGNSAPSQECDQVGPGITEVTRTPRGRISFLRASIIAP